jgi:hypothetical protein
LGGPLVAGYLISNNFKIFNEPGKAKKAWIFAIIATIVIFGVAFFIPNIDKIPTPLIPLIYTAIIYYLVKAFQGEILRHTYSWWRAILISIIGLIITVIPIFLVIFFVNAETSTAGGFQDVSDALYIICIIYQDRVYKDFFY